MASLIELDEKGLIGPICCLIKHFDKLTNSELAELLSIFEINYANICNNILPNKSGVLKAFKQGELTLNLILQTPFFKTMQRPVLNPELLHMIEKTLVPNAILTYKLGSVDESVLQYLSNLYPCIMTEEQIKQHCTNQLTDNVDEINNLRKAIGASLYHDKRLTETKLDDILLSVETAFKVASGDPTVLQYTGRYLALFALAENPSQLKDEICSLLDTAFRKKMNFNQNNTSSNS